MGDGRESRCFDSRQETLNLTLLLAIAAPHLPFPMSAWAKLLADHLLNASYSCYFLLHRRAAVGRLKVLLHVTDDLPNYPRLRPDVAVREADFRHFCCKQLVGSRRGDEGYELEHGSAVVLGPFCPGVGGEGVASDGEEAVEVEVEGFVDGLVPVEEGLVLEAFLDGEVCLGMGVVGRGVWGGGFVEGHFGAVGVRGVRLAGGFGSAHG